jgi:hypothetical protein
MKHILFSLCILGSTIIFSSCTKDNPEVQAQKKSIEGDWTYDNVTVRRSGQEAQMDVTADFDHYTISFGDAGKLSRKNSDNSITEDGKWTLEGATMTTSEGVTVSTGQTLTLNLKEPLFGSNIDEEWRNVIVGETALTAEHSKDGKLYTIRLRRIN